MSQTLTELFGRLHPLVLHLPIGLWSGVLLLEFSAAMLRRPPARGPILALAWFAALTGALAAGTGWVLGEEGEFTAGSMDPHRWSGVATAALGLVAALIAALPNRTPLRVLLVLLAVSMTITGHLGGNLTHGEGFLFGGRAKAAPKPPVTAPPANPGPDTPPTPTASHYQAVIAPILERTCVPCHGEDKQKAELRFDSPDAIVAGGENGEVLKPGAPDDSSMLTRLLLPLDHDDHMPPPKKPQPTPAEIEALRAWIAAGAPFTGPLPGGG